MGFVRAGVANASINQIAVSWGAGLVLTSPFASRGGDQVGTAVAEARNGGPFLQASRLRDKTARPAELALEVSYRGQVTPWLTIQPDLQYIVAPGMSGDVGNALALGGRFAISF